MFECRLSERDVLENKPSAVETHVTSSKNKEKIKYICSFVSNF